MTIFRVRLLTPKSKSGKKVCRNYGVISFFFYVSTATEALTREAPIFNLKVGASCIFHEPRIP